MRADGIITRDVAKSALEVYDVDELGLDRLDRAVLTALTRSFGGGPVGVSTLAVAVGEEATTVEEVCEPFLVRAGMIARTPRGRVATPQAWTHLGMTPPPRASGLGQPGLFDFVAVRRHRERRALITAALVFARSGRVAARLHLHDEVADLDLSKRTRAAFGTTAEEAETTKLLAFNQGFFNLFLAIVAAIASACRTGSIADMPVFGADPGRRRLHGGGQLVGVAGIGPGQGRAALTQGTFPAIAVVLLVAGLH